MMKANFNAIKYYLDDYRTEFNDMYDIKYEENNPILNYLNYWLKYKYCGAYPNEVDKTWLISEKGDISKLNDKYNYRRVKADSILSFWFILEPYIRYYLNDLDLIKYNGKIVKYNINNLLILKKVNWLKKDILLKKLQNLAELSYSRYNVMNLDSLINYGPRQTYNQKRYMMCKDQIWLCLYKSFKKDSLGKCFHDENHLKEWIKREKLLCCFKNNNISIENIKNIELYKENNYGYIEPTIDNYESLIEMYTTFINDRKKEMLYDESR